MLLLTVCDGKCVSFADEIVALKRLKMEKEKEGFPITSLREINTILKAQHLNIVTVRVRLQSFISKVFLFLKYSSWLLNALQSISNLGRACFCGQLCAAYKAA